MPTGLKQHQVMSGTHRATPGTLQVYVCVCVPWGIVSQSSNLLNNSQLVGGGEIDFPFRVSDTIIRFDESQPKLLIVTTNAVTEQM